MVLLYGGVFSGPGDDGDLVMEFFLRAQGIPYQRVTDRDMAGLQFGSRYRLFLVPPGHYLGPTPEWAFGGESARLRLREAVAGGLNYLGICSGALVATSLSVYPSAISLQLTDMVPRWKGNPAAGAQLLTVRLSPRLARFAQVSGGRTRVWYHNGPIFTNSRAARRRRLATFDPTPDERQQARGSFLFGKHLKGAPAIAEARHGRGRVILCSPHFEYGDGRVRDFQGRLQGWLAEHHSQRSASDPLAPGQPLRRMLLRSLGGRWLRPVRESVNWRVLTALVKDLLAHE